MKFKKMNILLLFIFIIFSLLNLINSKELFEDYYKRAEEIMSDMTLNQKIGQMFIARYNNATAGEEVANYTPAGYLLFDDNFANHTEKELISELRNASNHLPINIPLAFGVNEEGGTVCTASLYYREGIFPSPRESFIKGGINTILEVEKDKRELLHRLKLNYNFAPVADISLDPGDYMYNRSLGQNSNITSDYIKNVVDSYYENTFTCCVKHFPGYGNITNSPDDISYDKRPLDYLKKNDLVPFAKAIEHKVPMIMISHLIVEEIDKYYPSSLSKAVHDMLRNEYNYSGLIVTDSLSLGAITKNITNVSAAVLAVLAGNDLIVTYNYKEHYDDVVAAVNNNEINITLIEKAAKRVIAWKLQYIYKEQNLIFNFAFLYVFGSFILIGLIILVSCYVVRNKKKHLNNYDDEEDNNDNFSAHGKRLISNQSDQRDSEL